MKKMCFLVAVLVMFLVSSIMSEASPRADLVRNAESGNAQAQLELGEYYLNVEGNKELGFQWVKRASDQGYAPAEFRLAYLYDVGRGVEHDSKLAFKLYTSSAEKGYAVAQNNLGVMYGNGKYTQRNYSKALYWYRKAAEQGDPMAHRNLGMFYEYGLGVPKYHKKAIEYYTFAAERSNEDAKKALRRLNAPIPEPIKKDTKQAKVPANPPKSGNDFDALLEKAKAGNIESQFHVGVRYADGNGVPQDYGKAREWYEKAASRGHAPAQNNLGVLYHDGKGVPKDYRKAREWYEKAAAQNNAAALGNLGWMYQFGEGVNVDYKTAFDYYTRAANRNHVRSMNQLGWMYEHGEYVDVDYKQAMEWYLKGAERGNNSSMNNLGFMYEKGEGVSVDYNKAREWYEKAAAKGNETAKKNLTKLAKLEASQTAKAQQKPSAINVAKNTKNPPQQPKTQPKPAQPASPTPAQNNNGRIFANNTSGTKPRLAVLAFEDKSEERKANPDTIRTSMVTALHKTEIFNLQERERLDDLKDELTLGQSGLMDASTAAKIGKLRGAQYVMMGAITLCYYSEKASGFIFPILGFETRAKTAYVVIDIRIVDVETGDIVYTESKTGEASNKTKKNITKSEKMIGGLLDMATRNAIDKHVSAIKVLSFHS